MPRKWPWYISSSDFAIAGYTLMDIQQLTPHTAQFGAIEIPRAEYLRRLAEALCVSRNLRRFAKPECRRVVIGFTSRPHP